MDFNILGPFEIIESSQNIAPTALKPRQVIALLTLRRNSVVRTSELIDELWEDSPPVSAVTTLQTYIYKLRKAFQRYGAGEILQTRPAGYMLDISRENVDLYWFEKAVQEGRALLDGGDPARAAEILADALAIWRGPALVDVVTGNLLSAYVTRIEEVRFRTIELRIETELRLGHHLELIGELKSLVVGYPLHEGFHMSLMTALYHSGRRYEALDVYRTLRTNLVEELGLEPGREVQRLHQDLLSSDVPAAVGFEPGPRLTRLTVVDPDGGAAPARLPADITDFAGRERDVDDLCRRLTTPPGQSRDTDRIAVLGGMPGIGKTALAVHAAHQIASVFRDGQLYADLEGSTGSARDPAESLHSLLRALGVPARQIPEGLRERGALFRSVAAGRHLLLVLDDAASAAQVRPLLPGDPGCAVIVTSRRRLEGLADGPGIVVDALDRADGIELLARIVGRARVRRERDAAEALVDACDRHPLALRGVAGRLAAMPGYSLARMADELTDSRQALHELRFGDLDLRTRFESAYEQLGDQEQVVFGLLSILPAEFTADAAAELLGWEVSEADRVLRHFLGHHLLRSVHDDDTVRYVFPKLARMYARERLTTLAQVLDNLRAAPMWASAAQ
jgi:DNA-binding SARP family transcriptional activator